MSDTTNSYCYDNVYTDHRSPVLTFDDVSLSRITIHGTLWCALLVYQFKINSETTDSVKHGRARLALPGLRQPQPAVMACAPER